MKATQGHLHTISHVDILWCVWLIFSKAHWVAVWLANPTARISMWLMSSDMLWTFPFHPLTLFGKKNDSTDPRCSCVCFHAVYKCCGRASYWSRETLPKHLLVGKARNPNSWWSMYRMRQTAGSICSLGKVGKHLLTSAARMQNPQCEPDLMLPHSKVHIWRGHPKKCMDRGKWQLLLLLKKDLSAVACWCHFCLVLL